jgi:sugar lactone lactonase YvrE
MIALSKPETVIDGLTLPECPRWHDGALYFSDITAGRIYRHEPNGQTETVYQSADDFIGGLGFIGDELVCVQSKQRLLTKICNGNSAKYADLSDVCRFVLNDMATTRSCAYVSQPGFDIWSTSAEGMPPPTEIIAVNTTGTTRIAARNMMSPNGMAISPDGKTLYVAESTALRITCFDINLNDNTLSNPRVFATLPEGGIPDGICLDAAGAVWAAVPVAARADGYFAGPGVIRMTSDGKATHGVPVGEGRRALACVLGGPNRSTLYICTVGDFEGSAAFAPGTGRIESITVDFCGAGMP